MFSLEHHGIAGQRWGKRNGPPYPLEYSKHSKSERNANWQYSLNYNTNNGSRLKQISDNSTQSGKLSLRPKRKKPETQVKPRRKQRRLWLKDYYPPSRKPV